MELVSPHSNFDFLGKRRICFLLSALLTLGAFTVWFSTGTEKYGLDFVGGHEYLVEFKGDANSSTIAQTIETGGLRNPVVQSFEEASNQYSVRLSATVLPPKAGEDLVSAQEVRAKLVGALDIKFADRYEILQSDFIGPTVGSELRRDALWAIILGLIAITIYVATRFEFSFALGALGALFHDVILATGAYLLLGHELNMASLAAALTIVGYSVNDTIVVFDRVRELLQKERGKIDLEEILNRAMNQCLGRTLITTALTLFSALTLLIFGGGAIADLSLYLVAGIITGAYSTIYIAAPIVLWWETRKLSKLPVAEPAR